MNNWFAENDGKVVIPENSFDPGADEAGRRLLDDLNSDSTQSDPRHTMTFGKGLCALDLGIWSGVTAFTMYKGNWSATPWAAGMLATQAYTCKNEIRDTLRLK